MTNNMQQVQVMRRKRKDWTEVTKKRPSSGEHGVAEKVRAIYMRLEALY